MSSLSSWHNSPKDIAFQVGKVILGCWCIFLGNLLIYMIVMKLFNSKLKVFIAKKVFVLFALAALMDLIFIRQRWPVLAGLLTGAALGMVRFATTSAVFSTALSVDGRHTAPFRVISKYAVNQVFIIAALAASLMLSLCFFAGMVAGMLLVPFSILINGITEALGITCNNFK